MDIKLVFFLVITANNSSANPPSQDTDLGRGSPSHYPRDALASHQQAGSNSGFFTSLRGGAGSLLKNIRDTSSKVMQTVQQ